MSEHPNPPVDGVVCECGAVVFMVERAERFMPVGARMIEWVCAGGHQVGFMFDGGDLDLDRLRAEIAADGVTERTLSIIVEQWEGHG